MSEDKEKTIQEIQQLKNLLEAEKQEFLSVISHELRTPMTGVKGYLSMILQGDAGEVSEEVKNYVGQAYVANEHLIRLVDRMTKITEIQEGKFKFNLGKVDLGREARQVVKDTLPRAAEKAIVIDYEPQKEALVVKADPDRSREILLTLVTNAIKFTPEKGKIKVYHQTDAGSINTLVEDTGIGISQEERPRIFQLFGKGNLSLTSQQRGTGIGLYLARKLAEAQGGKLVLEQSEPGKGSIFKLALPKYK